MFYFKTLFKINQYVLIYKKLSIVKHIVSVNYNMCVTITI